jgi:hypothetical protein
MMEPRADDVERFIDRRVNGTRTGGRCLFCKQLKDQVGQFFYDNELGLIGWVCDDCIRKISEHTGSYDMTGT